MTSDMSMTERLMRHKNRILQRQLNVKLTILENEHKTTQKEILESQRDCSFFLHNLSSTWVGLEQYDQPDTRAMTKDSRLKDRRISMMSSETSSSSSNNNNNNNNNNNGPYRGEDVISGIPRSRSYIDNAGFSFPDQKGENITTCLNVLDEILQSYSKGRRKQERRRKIGVVAKPDVGAVSSEGRKLNGNVSGESRDPNNNKTASDRNVNCNNSERRVTLVTDTQLLQLRSKKRPNLVDGEKTTHRNGPVLLAQRSRDGPIKGILLPRPQTVSQERFTNSGTLSNILSSNVTLLRPQTAATLRRCSIFVRTPTNTTWMQRRAVMPDPYPPLPGEDYGRKRPKTAPTKYELYGRSPAVSRQTVAGIMAEVHSRCAETRRHLKHSKSIKNYVKNLHRPDTARSVELIDE